MTVLVVDDNPSTRRLATATTESAFRVICAENGADGLRAFKESNPDLILLDISMPDMDGHEVLRSVREVAQVLAIFMTALSGEEEIGKGLSEGAVDYITKPFGTALLLAKVKAVLRRTNPLQRVD